MSQIQFINTALTADGGANGIVTVADTTLFRERALVFLRSDTQTAKALFVDKVVNSTQLALRDPTAHTFARFDCSAFTTADTAMITQPEQDDLYTIDDGQEASSQLTETLNFFGNGWLEWDENVSGANKALFPNNLAEGLWFGVGASRYLTFCSTTGSEAIIASKTLRADSTLQAASNFVKEGYEVNSGSAYANTVTAHAGGGQANAVTASLGVTFVTVVATTGDSVKLPAAAGTTSAVLEVWNLGANSMNLFPPSGGTINGGLANAAIAVPANCIAYCRNRGASGTWQVVFMSTTP